MSTVLVINPGSGPVEGATEAEAVENMKHFLVDCDVSGLASVRLPLQDYGEGRFAFLVWRETRCHEIQMPGLPLAEVRYLASDHQNIWDYPRLYVDGSSWLWCYALLDNDAFAEPATD